MKAIRPLLRELSLRYHRRALQELSRKDPMSPDVPYLVSKINELEREL